MKNKYIKYRLKSGLRVILIPQANARSVTTLVGVGTGSKNEKKENNGVSHFLEHMFFKGTKKRPTPKDIAKVIDSVGGEQNAFTSKEMTGFWVKVQKEHLRLGLDVISDMLLNSKFSASALNRERGVIIEEINLYQDTPIYYISDIFEELLYGKQPAGRLIIGTKENILKVQRSDFLAYFRKHYLANNTVICIAGGFNLPEARKMIPRFFFSFRSGNEEERFKVHEKQKQPEVLAHYKKTDQTHLCLGVRSCNIFNKNRYAVKLLATILGGNMSSRLFMSLREKAGLCYYVRTTTDVNPDTGYLVTQAGVPNSKALEAVSIILKEYRLIRKNITRAELKQAKNYLFGKMLLSLESSDDLASYYISQELLENNIMTPEEQFKLFDKVSLPDIKRVAREIFVNEKLNLALIGPFKGKDSFLKELSL